MFALNTTITFMQMNMIALSVAENLDFNVLRSAKVPIQRLLASVFLFREPFDSILFDKYYFAAKGRARFGFRF